MIEWMEMPESKVEHITKRISDRMKAATAGTRYWSCIPGNYLDYEGNKLDNSPEFTGSMQDWSQLLLMAINDLSAIIHRKTQAGGANSIVCGPEVLAILETNNQYQPTSNTFSGDNHFIHYGTINKRWKVYCHLYMMRDKILVSREVDPFPPLVYSPDNFAIIKVLDL